nr:MAG TPA: hypothetical protein [Caudoviricetes sp.]
MQALVPTISNQFFSVIKHTAVFSQSLLYSTF